MCTLFKSVVGPLDLKRESPFKFGPTMDLNGAFPF